MPFERGVEQESHELRVVLVLLQGCVSQSFKDGAVILARDRFGHYRARVFQTDGAGLVIEDGGVEFFFGGEVAKDHRLRDARRVRDLFGGRAAKAALRKEAHGDNQDLEATLFARHAPADERARVSAGRGDLFAQKLIRFRLRLFESKYLLTISQKRSQDGFGFKKS